MFRCWFSFILSLMNFNNDLVTTSALIAAISSSSIGVALILLTNCSRKKSTTPLPPKNAKTSQSTGSPATPQLKTPDKKNNSAKSNVVSNMKLLPTNTKASTPSQAPKESDVKKNTGESVVPVAGGGKEGETAKNQQTKNDENKLESKEPVPPKSPVVAVTTAKDGKKASPKGCDLDNTQKSYQSSKKKKKLSAEKKSAGKEKKISNKDGVPSVPQYAPEMDVEDDEETLQNVKSLEKDLEPSLQGNEKS